MECEGNQPPPEATDICPAAKCDFYRYGATDEANYLQVSDANASRARETSEFILLIFCFPAVQRVWAVVGHVLYHGVRGDGDGGRVLLVVLDARQVRPTLGSFAHECRKDSEVCKRLIVKLFYIFIDFYEFGNRKF